MRYVCLDLSQCHNKYSCPIFKADMCCYKKTIYLSHVLKIRRVHKVLIKFFLLFDKDSCFQKYFPSSIGKITISQ